MQQGILLPSSKIRVFSFGILNTAVNHNAIITTSTHSVGVGYNNRETELIKFYFYEFNVRLKSLKTCASLVHDILQYYCNQYVLLYLKKN